MKRNHGTNKVKSVWWHLAVGLAVVLWYVATQVPLAHAPGILGEVALPEMAQWSTRAARWMLLGALVLAACGRGGAALAVGGVAVGLIGSVLGEWAREAADLLELEPEFAGKPLLELVDVAPGSWALGGGVVLWLVCVVVLVACPRGPGNAPRPAGGGRS
jgi:hypothetical protein